uniref:Coiled-coil domain containing 57 n=1 Tax=Microcebus murinus TaxID=30608 RepID=A0A8C5XU95_MICMU
AQAEGQGQVPVPPRPGPQPPRTPSVPQLQRKLREAARRILSLHLEKEQLIEMGNRLRADRGHAEGKPPRHPLPPTPEPQRPGVAPEAPPDRGRHGGESRPHVTAQDTNHAKKESFSEYPGKSRPHSTQTVGRNGTPRGREKQHRSPTVTCRSTHQKENRSPKPPQALEFPEEDRCHTHRSSSLASSSLQDTWKLLDLGSSPSGLTSQDDSPA